MPAGVSLPAGSACDPQHLAKNRAPPVSAVSLNSARASSWSGMTVSASPAVHHTDMRPSRHLTTRRPASAPTPSRRLRKSDGYLELPLCLALPDTWQRLVRLPQGVPLHGESAWRARRSHSPTRCTDAWRVGSSAGSSRTPAICFAVTCKPVRTLTPQAQALLDPLVDQPPSAPRNVRLRATPADSVPPSRSAATSAGVFRTIATTQVCGSKCCCSHDTSQRSTHVGFRARRGLVVPRPRHPGRV